MSDLPASTVQTTLNAAVSIRSLRLALVGKGGAGKSAISGTLCRIFARRGHQVLALDVDTMPGLAFSLGLSPQRASQAELPDTLAERVPDKGWLLKEGVTVAHLVKQHAVVGPDGVRFMQLGKLPERVKPGSTVAFRAVLEDFREEGWTLIGDLAAGTRQPFFGWSDFAEAILIIVEPTAKSTLSARRLAKLAYKTTSSESPGKLNLVKRTPIGIVANKVRDAEDLQRIQQALSGYDLPLLASVPFDPALAQAEQRQQAPIDAAPNAPAVIALQHLAESLEQWAGKDKSTAPLTLRSLE